MLIYEAIKCWRWDKTCRNYASKTFNDNKVFGTPHPGYEAFAFKLLQTRPCVISFECNKSFKSSNYSNKSRHEIIYNLSIMIAQNSLHERPQLNETICKLTILFDGYKVHSNVMKVLHCVEHKSMLNLIHARSGRINYQHFDWRLSIIIRVTIDSYISCESLLFEISYETRSETPNEKYNSARKLYFRILFSSRWRIVRSKQEDHQRCACRRVLNFQFSLWRHEPKSKLDCFPFRSITVLEHSFPQTLFPAFNIQISIEWKNFKFQKSSHFLFHSIILLFFLRCLSKTFCAIQRKRLFRID